MKMISREAVLAVADAKVKLIPVPEWGPDSVIGVKCMNGVERDVYTQWIGDHIEAIKGTATGKTEMKMFLLVGVLCDEAGKPLFTREDVEVLSVKSGAVLNRLFDAAMELNGLSESAKEDIRKNSDGVSAEPGSASPVV